MFVKNGKLKANFGLSGPNKIKGPPPEVGNLHLTSDQNFRKLRHHGTLW